MRHLKWIFIVVILLLCQEGFGQGWTNYYKDSINYITVPLDITTLSDGGTFIVGRTHSTAGIPREGYMVRTDVSGQEVWGRKLSAANTIFQAVELSNQNLAITYQSKWNDTLYLSCLDPNGNVLWTKSHGHDLITGRYEGFTLLALNNNNLILTNPMGCYRGEVLMIDSTGNALWNYCLDSLPLTSSAYPDMGYSYTNTIHELSDGNFVFAINSVIEDWNSGNPVYTRDITLVKLDANGNFVRQKKCTSSLVGESIQLNTLQPTKDGGFIVSGCKNQTEAILIKTDANFDTLWTKVYPPNSSGTGYRDFFDLVELDNGNFVAMYGGTFYSHFVPKLFILNNSGIVIDSVIIPATYDGGTNIDWPKALIEKTNDGGIVLTAEYVVRVLPSFITEYAIGLIKFDSLGNTYSNTLHGSVYKDDNLNCLADNGEGTLSNWRVKAIRQSDGLTFYGLSDAQGEYSFSIDTGSYDVSVTAPNLTPYWSFCNPVNTSMSFTSFDVDSIDFIVQPQIQCPLLSVDVSAPLIRQTGIGSNYTVSYCNTGTVDAQNAYVEVELDADLNVLGSSIPISAQVGDLYTFNIGNVVIGNCGQFTIQVIADASVIQGQAICTEAHIYPDSVCVPNYWNGPILDATALCNNDTVTFSIQNKGTPMAQGTQYFVYEDNIIFRTGTTNALGNNASQQIKEYALPGKTYRIDVKQSVGFPALLGDSIATAVIEGCQPFPNGTFSTGFVTNLSNGNSSPFVSVDCQPLVTSYDPNDKSAQPEGFSTPHYIYDYTPLDYKIRFQNTGTDTAFRVVIRDTLSAHLDVTSLEMGAASHNYTWRIYGQGILEITFDNVMLPDSNVNEPESNGFVRFRINQVPNNPNGTVIYNSAGIYFDYNAPIITNETFHTIGDNFVAMVITGTEEVLIEDVEVKVYPNPFTAQATLEVEGGDYQSLELTIYDITGRDVLQYVSTGNQKIQIQRNNLPQGVYIYRLKGDSALINTGKIIIK
ncbi:MAG: T9SS type A sorting domain-containing protein [Aureispira sp.]|nr:T9SS type A sorting domain-containing protein [Aureispira sp.]